MFNLQQKADTENRASEAKVWSVLVAQVWAGLAGYCHAPVDLKEVGKHIPGCCLFDGAFDLRPSVPHSPSSFHNCSIANQNSGPPF